VIYVYFYKGSLTQMDPQPHGMDLYAVIFFMTHPKSFSNRSFLLKRIRLDRLLKIGVDFVDIFILFWIHFICYYPFALCIMQIMRQPLHEIFASDSCQCRKMIWPCRNSFHNYTKSHYKHCNFILLYVQSQYRIHRSVYLWERELPHCCWS